MPDLSNLVPFHSGQVILFTCPGTSLKKFDTTMYLYIILDNYDELKQCKKPADLDLHCFQ